MEHKAISFEIKKEPDADGVFEGYASTFGNIDNGMDIVARGAFQKSLGKRKVRMLWQHDPNQPIGVWDIIEETERGLYVKGRISKDVQRGREAMALMRMDALDGISIGFVTKQASQEGNGPKRS
jgi:HK97 family phage prohead protease